MLIYYYLSLILYRLFCSLYDLLIEGRVSVDSFLYVQLNVINRSVEINVFYFTMYCAAIVLKYSEMNWTHLFITLNILIWKALTIVTYRLWYRLHFYGPYLFIDCFVQQGGWFETYNHLLENRQSPWPAS